VCQRAQRWPRSRRALHRQAAAGREGLRRARSQKANASTLKKHKSRHRGQRRPLPATCARRLSTGPRGRGRAQRAEGLDKAHTVRSRLVLCALGCTEWMATMLPAPSRADEQLRGVHLVSTSSVSSPRTWSERAGRVLNGISVRRPALRRSKKILRAMLRPPSGRRQGSRSGS